MITQSFLYNAIFFTYGLVLQFFFHVSPGNSPYYFMAFAAECSPRQPRQQPLLLHGLRGREFARPADHRPAVRHHRPPQDGSPSSGLRDLKVWSLCCGLRLATALWAALGCRFRGG